MNDRLRFEEISRIYDKIIEKYKEKPMVKEMTVSEIAKALGHEVKVVKEQPEPYQFKAGDVVNFPAVGERIRLIVQSSSDLLAVDLHGSVKGRAIGKNFYYGYEKVGVLKDYIK